MQTEPVPRPALRARAPEQRPDESVPKHWFFGNVFATHVANGVNLLFPAGERFFVRSVRHYEKDLRDLELRARVRGFYAQEGAHAREHDKYNALLEGQGFDVGRFLRFYETVAFRIVERLSPPKVRLAATAAAEHYTAIMAENSLRLRFLDHADPRMRSLLAWHAAEEIEHRDVAFDVLTEVGGGYAVRIAGLAIATAMLGSFWTLGAAMLLAQDPDATLSRVASDWAKMRKRKAEDAADRKSVFVSGIRSYLRRDFHPSQADIDHLAGEYLASVGLA
ncbi:metal-dependent hydrolase [soil metagenome]